MRRTNSVISWMASPPMVPVPPAPREIESAAFQRRSVVPALTDQEVQPTRLSHTEVIEAAHSRTGPTPAGDPR